LVDSPFGSHGVDVCTKLLHYENFPTYYNYQIFEPTKELKGYRYVVNMKIAQETPTTKLTLNHVFTYAFVFTTSLHFLVFVLLVHLLMFVFLVCFKVCLVFLCIGILTLLIVDVFFGLKLIYYSFFVGNLVRQWVGSIWMGVQLPLEMLVVINLA
jgi:hypothetical protein